MQRFSSSCNKLHTNNNECVRPSGVIPHEVATPSEVRDGALQLLLKEAYDVYHLLHGSMRTRGVTRVMPYTPLLTAVVASPVDSKSAFIQSSWSLTKKMLNPQEPSGVRLRQMVVPYYSDVWSRLLTGKKGDLGVLANGLCGREGTPLLPLARSTTLLAQIPLNVASRSSLNVNPNTINNYLKYTRDRVFSAAGNTYQRMWKVG
eukprot:8350363-Pyramimonas_sp.AAC.2